jgi:hypothetical protein
VDVLVRLAGVPRMRVLVFGVLAGVFVLVAVLVRMLVAVRHIAMGVFMRVGMRVIVRVLVVHNQSLHCHCITRPQGSLRAARISGFPWRPAGQGISVHRRPIILVALNGIRRFKKTILAADERR